MNKIFFIKLFLKSKLYGALCKIGLHPRKYYSHSYFSVSRHKVIDVEKCKLCSKTLHYERHR